ncbi:MAG: response regulator transcription factor [Chloroflexi bacterium]|nr:response regulator transcription factor [Chloroflexota bacterium]
MVTSQGNSGDKIRVLIADDHPLVRLALRTIIEKEADIEVVAEAEDGTRAVELARQLTPDVAIMDISMPRLSGLDATREIKARCPGTAVLVLTVHNDDEHILGIFDAGASGYLTKSTFGEEIPRTVRAIVAGETVLSPEVFRRLLKHALRYPTKPLPENNSPKLTARELEIIRLAARGMSNKDIAQALSLSTRTVKNYLAEIFSKLEVGSRTEAVITALRAGLVTLYDEQNRD